MRLSIIVLVFYLTVFSLWSFNIIPAPSEILIFIEILFNYFGLLGVFIAVLIESIVFLGLYFPGSFILIIAIFFSSGTFVELFMISFITSVALTIGSVINFYLGKYRIINAQIPKIKTSELWFLLTFLHPNSMAFYFYSQGLKNKNFNHIYLVFFFILPYGILLGFLIFLTKNGFKSALENPYLMIIVIFIWIFISYLLTGFNKKKLSKKVN